MPTASQTLAHALETYFAANPFDATSYTERWARFKVGPVPVIIPNTGQRKAALRKHDLHHVLTCYQTDLVGEAEIGAWEVATGCRRNGTAWALNLTAMAQGLFLAPGRIFGAFVRGRRSANLYSGDAHDTDMGRQVSAFRDELRLSEATTDPATVGETARFVVAAVIALVTGLLALLSFPLLSLVGWTAYFLGRGTGRAN